MTKFFIGILVGILSAVILIVFFVFGLHIHSGCQKCRQAQFDIITITDMVLEYKNSHGFMPESLDILNGERLTDPWGNDYMISQYVFGNYSCVVIWTFGSDGKLGGELEHEKDIYSSGSQGNCLKSH